MERKRIVLNFKNTPEDEALYQELKKYSCMSGYIKDVLRGILSTNNTIKENDVFNQESDEINDINDILM